MNRAVWPLLTAGLSLFYCGCSQNDFQTDKANAILASQPYRLDAEQLMLKGDQVSCGAQQELWEQPAELGDRTIARLTDSGRALHFDDDVSVAEPGFRGSHVQVRGDFVLMGDPAGVVHDVEQGVKEYESHVYVMINHPCFTDPVPVMGVRRGKFSETALPVTRFELTKDGWRFVRFVH